MSVRTRFAPSPTGFLHIGGARTALYAWAYARRHGGSFVLRIEDTDLERSTKDSVDAILDSLRWLGLDWDEGPFFQMQRLARYKEVAEQLIAAGHAYECFMSREELENLRKEQIQKGLKPRYDGRWRPERAKALGLKIPDGVKPVIRFRTPEEGEVSWNDQVKGPISFPNKELDDLVLLRADGVPTYNFGVVVDDLDMQITHVIRGDDHVNNTPRQLHIFKALIKEEKIPSFAHLPMILGADGERLSKRHGAVSVTQYRDEGFLPEALVNTLARLGWSHGDDEVFPVQKLVEWFDLAHVSHSPARFDPDKALWMNQQYIKTAEDSRLASLLGPFLETGSGPPLEKVVALLKDRANSLRHLAESARMFYQPAPPPKQKLAELVNAKTRPALELYRQRLAETDWDRESIGRTTSAVLKESGLKMPELATPVRLMLTGSSQTPSLDATLAVYDRARVLEVLKRYLQEQGE